MNLSWGLRTLALLAVFSAFVVSGPAAQAVDHDCEDFASSAEAQEYYNAHPGDSSDLDRDNDGYACDFGPPIGGTDSGQSTPRSTDSGESTGGLWVVLAVVAVAAFGFFWTRSSPRTETTGEPGEPISEEPPPRVLTSAPDPAYNVYIRLRNRSAGGDWAARVDAYVEHAGLPREQILRSLLELARQKQDEPIVDLATYLLRSSEAPPDDRRAPEASPARPAAGPLDERPGTAVQTRSPRQLPGHLDPYWTPTRHHNEKAETSIRKLWEHHTSHQLSTARKREFLQRPEVSNLATHVDHNYDLVVHMATKVAGDHPQGHLMLEEWLEAVRAAIQESLRLEERKIASQREAAENRRSAAELRRSTVTKCDSCGRAVGANGECGCS